MFDAEAYLFDMDGTICHTEPLHLAAVRVVLERWGKSLNTHVFETQMAGQTTAAVFSRLFPEWSAAQRQQLVEEKEQLFRDMAHALKPVPGVADFIARLRHMGRTIALVTNAPRCDVDFILGVLGMSEQFPIRVIASELAQPKPHPLAYLTALELCGAGAADALAFEDSITGVTSARLAGITTIGITTTLSADELTIAGASATMPDFAQHHLSGAGVFA